MADKRRELILALDRNAEASSIEWEAMADDTVAAKLNKGRVIITKTGTSNRRYVYVRIYNDNGILVDEFNDEQLPEDPNNDWYKILNLLIDKGRRIALGSDAVIDEIISEINGDIPF